MSDQKLDAFVEALDAVDELVGSPEDVGRPGLRPIRAYCQADGG